MQSNINSPRKHLPDFQQSLDIPFGQHFCFSGVAENLWICHLLVWILYCTFNPASNIIPTGKCGYCSKHYLSKQDFHTPSFSEHYVLLTQSILDFCTVFPFSAFKLTCLSLTLYSLRLSVDAGIVELSVNFYPNFRFEPKKNSLWKSHSHK